MARTIPAAVQTILDGETAEVSIVLEVFWGGSTSGPSEFYGDREIPNSEVQAKILSQDSLDEAVQVSGGGRSASYSVTLDDTDGEIKTIFDVNDIHKVPVKAYFYVTGSDFDTEKVEVFQGQINTPVNWSEGGRQFVFSVVNRIEDVEVGFSAEEGEFPELPEELIGKTWPLCFGTTINVPALRAVPAISGVLQSGVGIADFTLKPRLEAAEAITCPQTPIGFKCSTGSSGGINYQATCNIAFEQDQSCLQARCVEVEKLKLMIEEQEEYEYSEITVFEGTKFPQGRTITLNINGGLFRGFFDGTKTNPSNTFKINNRRHPDYDPATGGVVKDDLQKQIESTCPSRSDAEDTADSDFTDTAFGPVFTGLRSSRISWENYRELEQSRFFWAGGGSRVTMQDRQEIIYIANIVPSTIVRVAAFRNINGTRYLLTVPNEFFTTRQTNYGGYNVMEIVMTKPLSQRQLDSGGGWEDEIFVTQVSTVGPNTVDIIEWFIDTYTSFSKDSSSFADVKSKIDNYPMHFPLLRRPNILNILQELSQKARCALWQKQDTFYIKYLAETPTPVTTIAESDVLTDDTTNLGTLEISYSKTEDIVTKLTSRWRKDYRTDIEDNTLILRHNVIKYGTHAREEDYFPYAHLQLVRKSSTFWLIRWANTWKRLAFSVPLSFLQLEPFDAVTINLPDVASTTFTGVVERAVLDATGKQIDLEVWTPIRAGELTPYNFAFPADIAEKALFPSREARNANEAGSGTEPNFSTVAPPGHPLEVSTFGVYQGISLGCNGASVTSLEPGECRQDHGDRNPSDTGDEKPTVDVQADETGKINTGTKAVSNGEGIDYWSLMQKFNDLQKKAEGDASRAREYAAMNDDTAGTSDRTDNSGPVDNDFLDKLPDPDDVKGDCQITVDVTGFKTFESGTRPICLPGPVFEEIYVFDQRAAADEFCANLKANSRCGSEAPCTQCVNCTVSGTCPEEDEGDGNLIGYRGADGHEDESFMVP